MRRMLKRILLSLLLLIVVGYGMFALYYFSQQPNTAKCNEIVVEQMSGGEGLLISEAQIRNTVTGSALNPIEKSVSEIDTKAIEALLEKNKIIENDMLIKDVEVLTCETDPSDIVIVGFEPRNKTLIDTMPKRIKYLIKHYREKMFYSSSTAKAIDAGRKAMT